MSADDTAAARDRVVSQIARSIGPSAYAHFENGRHRKTKAMNETADTANVVVRPPIAWALAIIAGLAAGWVYPWRFVPASIPHVWVGGGVFAAGFALAIWAIVMMREAGTQVETHKPSTTIVADGPYRFTRNPIYLGMFLGQAGLAIGFDNLWMLAMLVPFSLVIRYGVIAREEAYLERKFGAIYTDYKSRVRRWL
jgi:protein-S-isoprenylcysteine O-methyltransferase Ste14